MFQPLRVGFVFICLGFGFLACFDDGSGGLDELQAVIDTVGDTVAVRTIAGSVWGDTAYLEAEVSIGMIEGPDEYLIGDPRSIAVGAGGEIYAGPGDTHVRT